MISYNDFLTELQKKHEKGPFKIRNSWGIYDIYKYIRKKGWYDIGRPLKEGEFYSIIRNVNKLLANEVANGNTVVFPSRMGKLELKKIDRGVSIVDGKIKNTYPIDWQETIKLWYEDEEARKNKVLLRNEEGHVYRIKYNKYMVNYENKSYYEFAVNKAIKKALKNNIKEGKIDTLW